MKILIVDDQSEKLKSIMKIVKENEGVKRNDVDWALDLNTAKEKLLGTRYDLLILDMNMSDDLENEPEEDAGTNFLEEIIYVDAYKKPREVVILTAYDNLEKQVKENPNLCGFTVLKYNVTSTEWSDYLKKKIEYILINEESEKQEQIKADVAIITAVKVESDAVKKVFEGLEKVRIKNDPTIYYQICINNITVVTAQQSEMGMAAAAMLSTKMIKHFNPKYLIMVGIAAGIGKDKEFGDIIIPSEVWNYSSGKYVEGGEGDDYFISFQPDPVSIPLEPSIREIVSQDFKQRLFEIRGKADDSSNSDIKVIIGPMACGSAVVANSKIVEELVKKHSRKTVGLDMESYGMFYAAKNTVETGIIPICIKSICDFADIDKGDGAQKYAALTSTWFARKMIEEDLEF